MDKPHYTGHRKRLRKKFAAGGAAGMHNYELIELLLTYAIPRKDVKPVAKELLARFKNIAGIFDADLKELCEIHGLSADSALLVSLMRELCSEYLAEKMSGKDVVSSPKSVFDFARMRLSGLKDEAFLVIYVNTKNHIIDYEVINEGTVDRAIIYPRNVIKKALAKNAGGLILVHNHPSGECEPSSHDIALTGAVRDAAKAMDIRLLDHIIAGKSNYFSFSKENLL